MKFPVTIPFPGTSGLPVHIIFETLAYTLGFRFYLLQRRRANDKITDYNRLYIFAAAAAGGFFGAHLLGILEQPQLLNQLNTVYFMANTSIVGGLLGGLFSVEMVKKRLKVYTSSGDMMVEPLILGMMIGRCGCFLAGIDDRTYGVATTLPWAVDFGDGVMRHPTNIYEILFLSDLWAVIHFNMQNLLSADGARFKFFLTMYLIFRFLIEFIKPGYSFSFGLSSIQLACLCGLSYYVLLYIYLSQPTISNKTTTHA